MMKLMFLMLAMFALVVGKVSAAEDEANDHLNSSTDDEGLIFYATFDKGVDADNAAGDANGFPSGPEAKRFAPGIQNQGLRIGKDIDADENFSLRFKGGKNISSERGTISFWIKPENWKGNNKAANMFVSAVKNKGLFYIYKYRDNNLLFYTDENKEVVRSRYNASAWQPLQWYHVAVTYDEKEQKLYVDGKLEAITERQKETGKSPFSYIYLGSRKWPIENGTSVIDELRIFNRVLTDRGIRREYERFAVGQASSKKSEKMTITVGKKSAQPDGVIQPGEYAVAATGFFDLDEPYFGKSAQTSRQGRYFLSYDDSNFYVGLQTPEDSATVLLSPDGKKCFSFVLQGNKVENNVWVAETAIPWSKLGDSKNWRINIVAGNTCISPVLATKKFRDINNFFHLLLKPDSPDYAIESVGNVKNGDINLKFNLSPGVSASVDYVKTGTAMKKLFSDTYIGKAEFSKKFSGSGLLTIHIQDAEKNTLYRADLQGAPASPVLVQYIYTDIQSQILQTVLRNESGISGGYVRLTMTDKKSEKIFEHRSQVGDEHFLWTEPWSIADLPPGDYDFEVQYYRDDKPFGEKYLQWYRRPGKTAPWDNNTIGIYEGYVPSPWTPIKTTANSATFLKQQYTFDNTILPSGLKANGFDILNRPFTILINDAELTKGKVKLLESKPDYAIFRTNGEWNGLNITADIRVEYDGMMWIKLNLTGKEFKLDRFIIDIPLKPEFAEQVHNCLHDSAQLMPEKGWQKDLYYKPAFWVGNDNAGISWYAENCKGWRNKNVKRSAEVIPGKNESVIRLNVIDKPLMLNGNRSIEFGLHGTPVKDSTNAIRPNRINEEWTTAWSTCRYYNYFASGPEFLDKQNLDNYRAAYSKKPNFNRMFQYIGSNGASPFCPEWGYWGKKWTSPPIGKYRVEGNHFNIEKRNKSVWTYACLNEKSFREFFIYKLNEVIHDPDWKIENLYYDLVGPRMCNNAEHGCLWTDDDGNAWMTQNLSGGREFHKRIYQLMKKERPNAIHLYHVTGQPVVSYVHAFADGVVEGETFFGNRLPKSESYFGVVEPNMFRVGYNSHKWGYPLFFIPQFSRSAYFYRPERIKLWSLDDPPAEMKRAILHFIGYTLVHDVSIWIRSEAYLRNTHNKIWEAMRNFFGAIDDEIRCIAYWKEHKPFSLETTNPERVLTTVYIRGNKAMFVTLNDTADDQPVTLRVNPDELWGKNGTVQITPVLDAANTPVTNNVWSFTVPAQIFRIYFAELTE